MADKIIQIKIDVTKIDKSKLSKGDKGTYLDCALLFNEAPDKFGNNGMIVQQITKEERLAGIKGNILGNGKVYGQGKPSAPPSGGGIANYEDDLPFAHGAFDI